MAERRLMDDVWWMMADGRTKADGWCLKVDIFFSKRSKRLCSFSWRKKKEPKEHPPYQASPIWEDVIDYGQRPPSIKVLVWFTKLSSYGWIISSLLWKHRDGSVTWTKAEGWCKMDDVRCKMGNPHIDSVERNGAGIFRVLNWHRKWYPPSRMSFYRKTLN